MDKFGLEMFFEQKYPWIENYIREAKGDIAYDKFLDALLDWERIHVYKPTLSKEQRKEVALEKMKHDGQLHKKIQERTTK
jgi:hypothetical protein